MTQGTERLELVWENIGRVERIRGMMIVYMDKVHAYLLPDSIPARRERRCRNCSGRVCGGAEKEDIRVSRAGKTVWRKE